MQSKTKMRCHNIPTEWLTRKRLALPDIGKNAKQLEILYVLVEI